MRVLKATRRAKVTEHRIQNGLKNKPIDCPKHPVPHHPPQLFVLHALMGFIGMRGSGKTLAMVNLVKLYQEEGCFNKIFIMAPTFDSNTIFHTLKPKPEDVFQNIHHCLADV